MKFRLIDSEWGKVLDSAMKTDYSNLFIVCPFIKKKAAELLFKHGTPKSIKVITRFNLGDFYDGVSDIAALRLTIENGAEIRGFANQPGTSYIASVKAKIKICKSLQSHQLSWP